MYVCMYVPDRHGVTQVLSLLDGRGDLHVKSRQK